MCQIIFGINDTYTFHTLWLLFTITFIIRVDFCSYFLSILPWQNFDDKDRKGTISSYNVLMTYNTFYYTGNERWEKKKQAAMSKSIVNNNITWHNKTLQNELDTFYIKGQNWWYRTSFHISYIFIFIPLTTTTTQDKNAMKILKIKPTLL